MAADIDVRAISAFLSLQDPLVDSLIKQPTADQVTELLRAIAGKVKDYQQALSQKTKTEVEFETYVRTSETKVKVLQKSRDKAIEDTSKLRTDLQNAETARSRVESELEQTKQNTTNEASNASTLKSRITSLESSSRDTLGLLESKTAAYDRLSQELTAQHSKSIELRKQVSQLETANQEKTSAVASAKFREQSLEQELDLQRKNNDWLENERKIKSDEQANFRKEKNARISQLTRSNEQYIEEAESLRRSENTLKARLDDQVDQNDKLLQDIQKLREKEIADADSHRLELDSVKRLAELQEQVANTNKERVQELSIALDEAKDEAADEIGRIRAEVEAEHQDREAAEQRVLELEARIVELESEVDHARAAPATPQREINLNGLATPARPGTPSRTFSPSIGHRLKGGVPSITVSQLYGEYKNLERQLTQERSMNEQLQTNLDQMLEEMETKRPEIEELRQDQTRLQSEVFEMSTLLENANQERDETIKETRVLQGRLDSANKELESFRQQLRDRNSQLRWMIMDREAQAQGDEVSEERYNELQRAAAEADERDSEHLSEMGRIVSQQLVLFKSVTELQTQNANQLEAIRRLVAELEEAQAKETQQQNLQLKEELEGARTKISDYQAEIKHMVAQSQSFVKERDMFKNMLTRRGQLQIDSNDFSRSMPAPAGGLPATGAPQFSQSVNGGESDYAKLLKDLQMHFDNYRKESSTDSTALRNQINELSKRNSQLQTDASRATAQVSAATQRYEMLQANFNMLKAENGEIQKRSYASMESATKQELKVQQAAEELVEARGMLDSLRRESANLKAEKDLWKNVERRLVEDNESLRNERARLEQLNGSLQNILNERDHADSETRRRLQSQVETLENELLSANRKLNEELEGSKRATLRREYEQEQNQKRIDDLMTSLSSTREELASAKTARDHLQARVDELTVELRSAEERLEVFTRPAADSSNQAGVAVDETITREQELTVEVSELKRDLELKSSELDRTNEQVDVYKGIAQQAEERLQELTETNDQYKEETEAALAEKDSRVKDLLQRLEDISSELNTTNSEVTTLRDERSEFNRKLDEQRSTLSAEIERLKEAEEKALDQANFNLEASKAQAQIATEAQQNYDNELLKHAEAAKTLGTVRNEANQIKLEIATLKSQADNARNDLDQKEASWSEMKDRYEREIMDVKKRRDELAQQNALLHGQLETLTQQVTELQKSRAALAESEAEQQTDASNKGLGDMQEVIKYLRREKEIVEVQYHLSTQEQKRLRQQLEFTQSQLDDVRLKLDQQHRVQADSERNALSHSKLMETLNELNLFRESSVTLRAEAKQATQSLREKTEKIEELESAIQPLQAKIAELENLSELREGEMKLLQDDRDHWQQRCQNILSKYDRVDPAELESLKTTLAGLEKERDEAVVARSALQEQIDAHPAAIEAAKADLRSKLGEQFKARSKELSQRVRDKQAELDAANTEKSNLQAELHLTQEQLEVAQAQANSASTIDQSAEDREKSNSDNTELNTRIEELQAKVLELETSLTTKEQELTLATASSGDQESASSEQFKIKEVQLKDMLNKRLAEVKREATVAKDAALDELRQQLEALHQQEMESLRASSVPMAPDVQEPTGTVQPEGGDMDITKTENSVPASFDAFVENLTEEQARTLVQKNETVRNIVKTNIRSVVAKKEEALRKEFAATAPTPLADGASGLADSELAKNFEAEKESIIEQKEQEFAAEREQMQAEFDAKLEAERETLVAQRNEELASEKLFFDEQAELKIAEQVKKAEQMAEQKSRVKLNMSENRGRAAQAKLDVVKKAAEETPDKPVKEVWEVAQSARPAPAAQLQPQPQSQAKPAPVVGATPTTLTAAVAQPTTTAGGSNAVPGQPNSTDTVSADVPVSGGTSEQTSGDAKNDTSQTTTDEASSKPIPVNGSAGSGLPTAARGSGLPRGSFRGARAGAAATQQGQGHQTTSIPRGSGIPRTGIPRGRGGARGGSIQTGNATGSAPSRGGGNANSGASPRASLNPNAQQFTPGSKRAREDGGDEAGQGKRIRGGGAGS